MHDYCAYFWVARVPGTEPDSMTGRCAALFGGREPHMRKSRLSEEQIIGILRRVENGQPVMEVC